MAPSPRIDGIRPGRSPFLVLGWETVPIEESAMSTATQGDCAAHTLRARLLFLLLVVTVGSIVTIPLVGVSAKSAPAEPASYSIWRPDVVPASPGDPERAALELGV